MRCLRLPVWLVMMGIALGCMGCGEQEPAPSPTTEPDQSGLPKVDTEQEEADAGVSAKEVRQELDEATEAVSKYSQQRTQEAAAEAQKNLDELKEKIATLKDDVSSLQQTGQEKFKQSIDDLDENLNNAQQKMNELREKGTNAWAQAEDDLHQSINNLQEAYEEAAASFENSESEGGKSEKTETSPAAGDDTTADKEAKKKT